MNIPVSAVNMPTRKTRETRCRQTSHAMSVTKIDERFARSVELATEVHTIDQCQTPRSSAKKIPAQAMAFDGRGFAPFSRNARSHSSGTASAARQNALATGPVSERRTRMGAKAMEQPPARRQTKAAVEARSLKGPLKYSMSKAFTREDDAPEDDFEGEEENPIPPGSKNYLTPAGWQRMREEVKWLVNVERPDVTRVVSWAASLGDRSENADYQYGKKRLREIDRRIRYLTKRLEAAEVVDPATREDTDQVFFGATVTYVNSAGEEQTVRIVGIDEMDPSRHYVSWISPVARALIKAREGETVRLQLPSGEDQLEIVEVRYEAIPISPFEAPKRAWNPNA